MRALCEWRQALLWLGLLAWPAASHAQPVLQGTEDLSSDRPEAWAIKYYTSTTLLTGLAVPRWREAGSVVVGGEAVWIPFLSTDQRRVGFNGTKTEDLNKAPVFARPRLSVGLPAGLAVTVAFVPPIEAFGVEPRLLALALEGPLHDADAWALGLRVFGQAGSAEAAFTCSDDALVFPPGSEQNPTGCLGRSSDKADLRYFGLELSAGGRRAARVEPHVAVAVAHFDNRFETGARRFDVLDGARVEFIDRTVQRSEGTTFSLTGGVGFRLADRLDAALDLFYTPLWVRRQEGAPRQHDGLLSAKVLLRYRIR
jgi:hypothetical protein